jgi:Zn-dependent protease
MDAMMLSPQILALAPIWYAAFLLSITCHEAAHALAAKWGGDLTAFHQGQVTLNPIPHMRREPTGTILVPLLSFLFAGWMIGWASAPYDREWRQRHPHRAGWMALAGPAANLLLMLLAALAIHAGLALGFFTVPDSLRFTHVVAGTGPTAEGAAVLVSIVFSLNLLLAAFNLIPVPPLDGSTALGLLLPAAWARSYARFLEGSPLSFLGIFLAWKIFDRISDPLFATGFFLLYPGGGFR